MKKFGLASKISLSLALATSVTVLSFADAPVEKAEKVETPAAVSADYTGTPALADGQSVALTGAKGSSSFDLSKATGAFTMKGGSFVAGAESAFAPAAAVDFSKEKYELPAGAATVTLNGKPASFQGVTAFTVNGLMTNDQADVLTGAGEKAADQKAALSIAALQAGNTVTASAFDTVKLGTVFNTNERNAALSFTANTMASVDKAMLSGAKTSLTLGAPTVSVGTAELSSGAGLTVNNAKSLTLTNVTVDGEGGALTATEQVGTVGGNTLSVGNSGSATITAKDVQLANIFTYAKPGAGDNAPATNPGTITINNANLTGLASIGSKVTDSKTQALGGTINLTGVTWKADNLDSVVIAQNDKNQGATINFKGKLTTSKAQLIKASADGKTVDSVLPKGFNLVADGSTILLDDPTWNANDIKNVTAKLDPTSTGKLTVVALGQQVNEKNEPVDNTLAQAATLTAAAPEVALTKSVAVASTDKAVTIANNLSAGYVDMTADTDPTAAITVSAGKTLDLAANADALKNKSLISTKLADNKVLPLTVNGTLNATGGNGVALGAGLTVADGGNATLKDLSVGSVTTAGTGALNLDGVAATTVTAAGTGTANLSGNTTVDTLTNNTTGAVTVAGNATVGKVLTLGAGANVTVTGNLTANGTMENKVEQAGLNATAAGLIFVNGGHLTASVSSLNGTTIFTDPAYADAKGATIAPATAALTVLPNNEKVRSFDGKALVGRNSIQYIGDGSTVDVASVLPKALALGDPTKTVAQKTPTYVGAVAVVTAPITVADTGALVVDPSKEAANVGEVTPIAKALTAGALSVTNNGVLIVNAASQSKATDPIITSKTTDLAGGYVEVLNVKPNTTYTLFANTTGDVAAGDIKSTPVVESKLLDVSLAPGAAGTKTVVLTTAIHPKLDEVFAKGSVLNSAGLDKYFADVKAAQDKANAAATADKPAPNLFDTALTNIVVEAAKGATTPAAINDVEQAPSLAGVQGNTLAAATELTDAVYNHAGSLDKNIWASYVHQNRNVSSMELGAGSSVLDGHSKTNGVVLGADLGKAGDHVFGLAASYVKGTDTNANTAYTASSDKDSYYGVSFYDRYKAGDLAVLSDLSYTHGNHDLSFNTLGVAYGDKINASAFSVGVRAEKEVKMADGNFTTPYVGLRYTHLNTGDFKLGDLTVKTDSQNVLVMPIGVKFAAVKEHGNWTVRPSAEVAYNLFLTGRDATSTSVLAGSTAEAKSTVLPRGLFAGKLGVSMSNGSTKYGVYYEYATGSDQHSHQLTANASFKF